MRIVFTSVFLSFFAIAMVSCLNQEPSFDEEKFFTDFPEEGVTVYPPARLAKYQEVYAIKGTDTLDLDVYQMESPGINEIAKPVVIFVHGGGFFTGKRNETNIEDFCKFLAKEGYLVVNMDYRLTLKGRGFLILKFNLIHHHFTLNS